MARPTHTSPGAEQISIYLSQDEQFAIDLIHRRRKKRGDARNSRNEIVADAIWHLLSNVEHVRPEQVTALLDVEREELKANVKPFPKRTK